MTLTPRQEQIMDLIVDEGLSYKQIALRLGLAYQTVKNHLVSGDEFDPQARWGIYRRMGCHNLTGAAVAYLGYRSLKARGLLNGHSREESTWQ